MENSKLFHDVRFLEVFIINIRVFNVDYVENFRGENAR